jgi:hypothetical protein
LTALKQEYANGMTFSCWKNKKQTATNRHADDKQITTQLVPTIEVRFFSCPGRNPRYPGLSSQHSPLEAGTASLFEIAVSNKSVSPAVGQLNLI